jgi:hypothetical protein
MRPLPGIPRDRALIRHLAFAAGLAILLGQAAAFQHLVTVRHAVCSQHGEVIDLGHDKGHATHATHAHSEPLALRDAADGLDAEHHQDHHCTAVSLWRQSSSERTAAPRILPLPAGDAPSTAPQFALHPHAVPLLRLAPSHSPPRV